MNCLYNLYKQMNCLYQKKANYLYKKGIVYKLYKNELFFVLKMLIIW